MKKSMKDLTKKYKSEEYDYSCSECFLHAGNDFFDLNLDKKTFKIAAPFSGGMFTEGVCGIVTAGLMILGVLFTNDVAHKSSQLKEISKEWVKEFENVKKSIQCNELKKLYRDPITNCNELIYSSAELFQKIVCKYYKK